MRGIGGLVVVEVDIHIDTLRLPALNLPRPIAQGSVAVAALIFAAGAVQADVNEVGSNDVRRLHSSKIEETKCRVVPA